MCAGLTGVSADTEPELGELFDALVEVAVDERGGTLIEAAPDELRVLFGAPESAGTEGAAAHAALRLSEEVEGLCTGRRPWATLRLRVGLHTGIATVGLLGPARRREYRPSATR